MASHPPHHSPPTPLLSNIEKVLFCKEREMEEMSIKERATHLACLYTAARSESRVRQKEKGENKLKKLGSPTILYAAYHQFTNEKPLLLLTSLFLVGFFPISSDDLLFPSSSPNLPIETSRCLCRIATGCSRVRLHFFHAHDRRLVPPLKVRQLLLDSCSSFALC